MAAKLLFPLILLLSEHNFVLPIESTQTVLMSLVILLTIPRSIAAAQIVRTERGP
jgi:hypothetical protein